MLTLGIDSYVTLDEAETYISENYMSNDAKPLAWAALSAKDREILLRKAAKIIDRQILIGRRAYINQVMEFPRTLYTDSPQWPLGVQNAVPEAVKAAQCEIALEKSKGTSGRVELQREGVKSFSLGKLSESYSGSPNSIESYEAKQLLAPFMGGGVTIV